MNSRTYRKASPKHARQLLALTWALTCSLPALASNSMDANPAEPAGAPNGTGIQRPAEITRTQVWRFRVLLDDRDIGEHSFTIVNTDQGEKAQIEANFKVKVAFFTAYQYSHSNTEHWDSGCLSSIISSTDDNGEVYEIEGQALDNGFELVRNQQRLQLEKPCLQSFAYWRPSSILDSSRLLNSQTGELQAVEVRFSGPDQVQYGDQMIDSERYVIETQEGEIRLWYATDTRQWLALESPTDGGRTIRYQPLLLPDHQQYAEDTDTKLALN